MEKGVPPNAPLRPNRKISIPRKDLERVRRDLFGANEAKKIRKDISFPPETTINSSNPS
jgi:hypothetical protein